MTIGTLSYAKAAQEGIRMAFICDGYPEVQVSKEKFTNIQRAIGGQVDGLPEEGFSPRLIDMYWTKGDAVVVCLDKETRDWLANNLPTLRTCEGPRLKIVGLDALPTYTYKRVVAWLLGPVEDTGRYLHWLHRLNWGLDTDNWRVYECKEEPSGVRLVLSIESKSITALERLGWQPFSGVGHAAFSLLSVKPERKKKWRWRKRRRRRPN
jgi:hypothetical protein